MDAKQAFGAMHIVFCCSFLLAILAGQKFIGFWDRWIRDSLERS